MKSKVWIVALGAIMVAAGAMNTARAQDKNSQNKNVREVRELLSHLQVDKPRRYKSMVVFPLRYSGKQASGNWETMGQAIAGERLKVRELADASVPEVEVENIGENTVFLLSGEIISGGKQTRTIRKDTVIEPKQIVKVPVFCVEHGRWSGSHKFGASFNYIPSTMNSLMKSGAGQHEIWSEIESRAATIAPSPTSSLDEVLNSDRAQQEFQQTHKELGKFSPPDTIGIAVADSNTGRIVGIELFGRRDLFEQLQDKLIEGYASDIVLAHADYPAEIELGEKDVQIFISNLLELDVRYEDTPGSGRGIDISSGTLQGKGVALGDNVVHLSVQEIAPKVEPVRPIVNDPQIRRHRMMPE